ncbi:MAG: hypothetical protein ACLFRB_04340 [Thiohalorhabdus sp.]|uniref:hypothetical protein n=1 Tax=Thiohalorhabdus sp. TaxID=3094134 RepID=UPI003980AA64
MDQQQRRWLRPWREVKSETYYPSPGLIRLRGRHQLRTPRRPLDAREAAALVREVQEVHDRFQDELDRCVDQLLERLYGPEPPSDGNGSS